MKKVFFFPYYFYQQYEPFRQVITSLRHLNVNAYMICMHCKSFDESKEFGPKRMKHDKCPFKMLPLCNIGRKKTNLLSKFIQFFGFLINCNKIKKFLRAEQPDLIVVGSDLGGIYIRFIINTCQLLHIPVLIMVSVNSKLAFNNINSDTETKIPFVIQFLFRLFGLEQLFFFNNKIIGSYSQETKIIVASKNIQNQLIKKGISKNRIFIKGIPIYDKIYKLIKNRQKTKTKIYNYLGINSNCHLVVYCTQMINLVYGEKYSKRINKLLFQVFEKLPNECKIVIKLHPRESAKNIAIFSKIFANNRYRIVRNINTYQLLQAADLVISHFSATLSDAILLETPVLSINILNDQTRTLFSSSSQNLLQIKSEAEFSKIYNILYNKPFRKTLKSLTKKWIKNNSIIVDGHVSERIAYFIKHIINS